MHEMACHRRSAPEELALRRPDPGILISESVFVQTLLGRPDGQRDAGPSGARVARSIDEDRQLIQYGGTGRNQRGAGKKGPNQPRSAVRVERQVCSTPNRLSSARPADEPRAAQAIG